MRLLAALVLAVLTATAPVGAQTTTTGPPAEAEPAEPSLGFDSPQATMRGFLTAARDGDWLRASDHLDLRGRTREEGAGLARKLKIVLDRSLWVDLGALDDTLDGYRDDGLPPRRDLVGMVYTSHGGVKILVERLTAPDGSQEWKIARPTVQQIPAMYDELGDAGLVALLPRPLVDLHVLEVALWQWIALAVLVAVAAVAAWLLTGLVRRAISPIVRRTSMHMDDALRDLLVGPMRLVVATVLLSPGILALKLTVPARRVALGVQAALLIVAVTWVALRLTDAVTRVGEQRLAARGPSAGALVPLVRRTAKVFVVAIALLLVLANFGFDVTGIVAGLGVGGLAVALAAQKSLENLFGGLSIIADAPVRIGDLCRFGDRVGTVEDIGLRSTRVRTLDRTVVTVPNSEFATMQLENFGVRDRLLLQAKIGLRYDTSPEQLRAVIGGITRLLREQADVAAGARVRFVGFGATSLDLELFAYIATVNFERFMVVREEIFLRIMDVVAEAGAALASPLPVAPPPAPARPAS